MEITADIRIRPADLNDNDKIRVKIARKLKWSPGKSFYFTLVKKSIDARKQEVFYLLRYLVDTEKEPNPTHKEIEIGYKQSGQGQTVVIVGAGPAGYFAALECVEHGLKPIVLERGKDVRERRRDLRAIQQFSEVNPDSNYCFGEGGAGTYSDGKLYTRSKKRGSYIKVLKILVDHGAKSDILIDAHPHIGSNKLPHIISSIRATIEKYGGEVRFGTKVTDFVFNEKKCEAVIVNDQDEVKGDHFILATGHSARDIYHMLHSRGLALEPKPFALGVRIEHPQALIDEIQYNQFPREENLPPAAYKLVCQVKDRGVFSFCMCPGGLIVPSATSPGEIVVNGMSLSKRDSPFANSGIVTAVESEELKHIGFDGLFGNMNFQAEVEQSLFKHGDGSQKAPAQNMIDFVNGKTMLELNECSYIPGIYRAPLHELLPGFIYERLKDGLLRFSHRMKGYYTDQANVVAVESRTSSPVRIPRDKINLHHPDIFNLYPCGEGAGYAGGILSAAMDGQKIAGYIHSLTDRS
ncbi:MAG: FAD-binding protein [Saprospiraceae bacterium]|nr:FAD-binding protein [Saprospiraceae bacterium]